MTGAAPAGRAAGPVARARSVWAGALGRAGARRPRGASRPPRVELEGVRAVPLGVLRVVAVVLAAGAFAVLGPAVVAWFVVGPLLLAALAPGGTWAVLVAVGLVGVSLASTDAGVASVVLALALPLAVHLSLLADAASRSDLRGVGVDVRLLVRALRSTLLGGACLVPFGVLVVLAPSGLPGWLGAAAVVGVVGLAVLAVRLTSSSRAR